MTQADKKAEFDKQIDEIKDDANNLVEEYDCDVYRNPLIDKAVKLAIEYGKGEERERILSIINTLYADWMKEMPCDRRSGALNGAKIIKTKIEEGK